MAEIDDLMGAAEDLAAELMSQPLMPGTICQWFALCDHPATSVEPHPILGGVPICDRCAARVAALR